jgi:hypothetical protein
MSLKGPIFAVTDVSNLDRQSRTAKIKRLRFRRETRNLFAALRLREGWPDGSDPP